jgi:hypothetical protein
MASSTLNVFQRLARQWDAAHPYNAAQVLKIQGTPDPATLHGAWHDTLNALGLGRVRLDGGSFSYELLNGEISLYGICVVKPLVTLEDHISEQLNRRFDNPSEPPFRPFVLAGDGFYYLGVVYHHWVADSVSIRTVLREWFVRVFDPKKATHTPVRLPQHGYRRFFDVIEQASAMGHGLLTAARWASTIQQVRRIEYYCGNDLTVRFTVRNAPAGWIKTLLGTARTLGVTLNDMFLAAIAQVCNRYVPLKSRPRRRGLALGSIVDLRPYCGDNEFADAFGLFLGFTNVFCRPRDFRSPQHLLQTIALQNSQQKRRGIPQASALRMLIGVALGSLISPGHISQFYQKHCPMAGGISNVNMNRSWASEYHPSPLLDYIRVSPTGPMMPLVFATTTLGENFHFALTYRPSVVPPEQIELLCMDFLKHLSDFAR